MSATFREMLVDLACHWQDPLGVTPAVNYAVARYDAAALAGLAESRCRAVASGADFDHEGLRYQVIASRDPEPARIPVVRRRGWDCLIWLVYDRDYALLEAWRCEGEALRARWGDSRVLGSDCLRLGEDLLREAQTSPLTPGRDCRG